MHIKRDTIFRANFLLAFQQMCFQEGFQCSQGGAALQKELFEELQNPGEELLKQMSRKGEGVMKKEHVGSGEAERSWQGVKNRFSGCV